jgi:methylglutaconyl-CoA hydratase
MLNLVLLDIKDGVAWVTLNRPEVHNAFDEDVIAQLTVILGEISKRDNVCAVVLQGSGKSFSAGGDMNWMQRAALYTEEQNYEDALNLALMLNALYTLPQVTIALMQGAAMGGGMGLACCCDIVIADKDAIFALSEVKIGLIPATIGPYVMAALGPRQCRRFFQTGERFSAQKALEIGLVHEIAERPEDRDQILQNILKLVAANGPKAMRAAKKLAHDLSAQPLSEKLMKDTAKLIAATRATDEAKEGLSAFLEKRKAGWTK